MTRHVTGKRKNPSLELYSPDEREYYRSLSRKTRRIVIENEEKICRINDVDTPMRFKILLSEMSDDVKTLAIKKLEQMDDMCEESGEYVKMRNWLEALLSIPIGKYQKLPISKDNRPPEIREFLLRSRTQMDEYIYGHGDTKDYILRLLAQWIINPHSKGMVIGVHGPMGCGKTTLIKDCICRVLQLPFAFIPLGGCQDSSFLEGHSYTYEGATWGKIVDVLMKSKCMNPVFYFDELDKVSDTRKGQEIINVLMHVTDQTQNDRFNDKYFRDLEFDLSKCLIIFSYNDDNLINPILKDRMIKIETRGYDVNDKVLILRKHIIPEIAREFNFDPRDLIFSDEVLRYIIQEKADEEQGVRNAKRAMYDVMSQFNLARLLASESDEPAERSVHQLPFAFTKNVIKTYIPRPISMQKAWDHEKRLSMYL